ncbi:MAG: signal peptidase II [[Clostridium] scindens]
MYNKGFLLNSLESHPALIKTVSILAGAGVLACGAWTFARKGHFTEKLGMAILGAGASSNIFDRLSRGKVIDYIGIRSKNQFLARLTANLGDFYILLGAVLLALKNGRK